MQVYTGSVQWVQHYDIAPRQTMAISIDSLIRNQESDSVGTKLPATAASGVVLWSSPSRAGVFGRLVETNQGAELARSFSCGTKTTLCGAAQFTPSTLNIAAGSSAYTILEAPTCTGPVAGGCASNPTHTFGSGSSYVWYSGNDSIAAPPSPPFTRTGTFQGVAAGQTSFTGTASDFYMCHASGGGTINVFQFAVAGKGYIFVGTDPNIVTSNSYYASDGEGDTRSQPGERSAQHPQSRPTGSPSARVRRRWPNLPPAPRAQAGPHIHLFRKRRIHQQNRHRDRQKVRIRHE